MKWNEFKSVRDNQIESHGELIKTTIECPVCGELVWFKTVSLASYPPMFGYTCRTCGWYGTAFRMWHPNTIQTADGRRFDFDKERWE